MSRCTPRDSWQEHDAVALLVVNDAETTRDGDDLLDFNYTAFGRNTARIPVYYVRRSVLERMLTGGPDKID